MADFDDLEPIAPPPTRPATGFAVERHRLERSETEPLEADDGMAFRLRVAARRMLGSSTAILLATAVLAGGTVAIARLEAGRPAPEARAVVPNPSAPTDEIVAAVPTPRQDDEAVDTTRRGSSRNGSKRADFRFRSIAGSSAASPAAPVAAPVSSPQRGAAEKRSGKPKPSPSPSPYTPNTILIRLVHPNGAYFFTTDNSTAMHKEGYEGYVSERAALVWSERRGPTMVRLELSDDSVGFIYARESDVDTGEPAPLYAASTRRYGRFYSLDREEAAEIGPVVVYGWVATY